MNQKFLISTKKLTRRLSNTKKLFAERIHISVDIVSSMRQNVPNIMTSRRKINTRQLNFSTHNLLRHTQVYLLDSIVLVLLDENSIFFNFLKIFPRTKKKLLTFSKRRKLRRIVEFSADNFNFYGTFYFNSQIKFFVEKFNDFLNFFFFLIIIVV